MTSCPEEEKKQFLPVMVIGRQPGSNVWVLNETIQLSTDGKEIPEDSRVYVFETSLIERISPPIQLTCIDNGQALKNLIMCMKALLGENFYGGLFMLAGMAMSVHANLIHQQRHAMPMVMAVGEPKSGKSTALECAASLTGVGIFATGSGFSFASAMEQGNASTMGYCIDDIKDDKLLHDIVIATYNKGGLYVNMYAGRKVPKCSPVMTSNWTTDKERISSRLALVPFTVPKEPLRGRDRMIKERALTAAQAEATKSISVVVSLGNMYMDPLNKDCIYGDLAEWVLDIIGDTMTREAINYAELIFFLKMICDTVKSNCTEEEGLEVPDDWPSEEKIKSAFKGIMANLLPSSNTAVTTTDSQTMEKLKEVILHVAEKGCPLEVLTYMLPKVVNRSKTEGQTMCIAINLQLFLAKNKEMDNYKQETIKEELKAKGVFMGAYQNHFLQPGWSPPESDALAPVRIKRNGEGKNAKSLTCIYIKRSAFFSTQMSCLYLILYLCAIQERERLYKLKKTCVQKVIKYKIPK